MKSVKFLSLPHFWLVLLGTLGSSFPNCNTPLWTFCLASSCHHLLFCVFLVISQWWQPVFETQLKTSFFLIKHESSLCLFSFKETTQMQREPVKRGSPNETIQALKSISQYGSALWRIMHGFQRGQKQLSCTGTALPGLTATSTWWALIGHEGKDPSRSAHSVIFTVYVWYYMIPNRL